MKKKMLYTTQNTKQIFGVHTLSWLAVVSLVLLTGASTLAQRKERGVSVVPNEATRRVDIFVEGQPFTSYIWPETLKKPVLYPLNAASGTPVTRGFPMDPRPGERVDHPHHVGLWFNYGDVNGVDFWNNSTALKPEAQNKMGTIIHRRIVSTKSGKESGELAVEMDWIMPDGKAILRETTKFVFHASPNIREVDRVTTLTALGDRVIFHDNKEGVIGMRVRRELEQPSKEPLVFTDASGRPTSVARLDNTGVAGNYLSSEGKTGDAVWGTRGRWAVLTGKVGEQPITLALFDHPENVGYPTYWHARGYGLFAANPFGQEVFSNGKEKLNFKLEPKQKVTFRHRLLILSGPATTRQMDEQYRRFVAEVK
ncbi:MAG: PmoA family protein [Pyrinomonadaceae bacterium]